MYSSVKRCKDYHNQTNLHLSCDRFDWESFLFNNAINTEFSYAPIYPCNLNSPECTVLRELLREACIPGSGPLLGNRSSWSDYVKTVALFNLIRYLGMLHCFHKPQLTGRNNAQISSI